MQTVLNLVTALAMIALVGVLGFGLWNMMRGGPGNLSQKLMRWRVIVQAIVLVLLLATLFLFGGSRG